MLKDLENTPIKKTKTEHRIIEARKTGKSIYLLDDDIRHTTDQIIVRGAAIYGCDMPQTDFLASILSKEIISFIKKFDYDGLTVEEIILAMQINSHNDLKNPLGEDLIRVEFVGRFIYVDFLAKVLKNYMVLRNSLDRKFQNQIDGFL